MIGNGRLYLAVRTLATAEGDARAHMWFNIAASYGATYASKNRDIVAAKMTPHQIELAQQMARDCVAQNYKQCN